MKRRLHVGLTVSPQTSQSKPVFQHPIPSGGHNTKVYFHSRPFMSDKSHSLHWFDLECGWIPEFVCRALAMQRTTRMCEKFMAKLKFSMFGKQWEKTSGTSRPVYKKKSNEKKSLSCIILARYGVSRSSWSTAQWNLLGWWKCSLPALPNLATRLVVKLN